MKGCGLCARAKGGTCALHRATDPEQLSAAVVALLRAEAGAGLAALLDNAFQAILDGMPEVVLAAVARVRRKTIDDAWYRLMGKEQFTLRDLRQLAALSLARVVHYEATHRDEPGAGPDDGDDGDDDGSQEADDDDGG